MSSKILKVGLLIKFGSKSRGLFLAHLAIFTSKLSCGPWATWVHSVHELCVGALCRSEEGSF